MWIGEHPIAMIDAALAAPGFTQVELEKTIMVGFGHHAVLGVADQVIAAVKTCFGGADIRAINFLSNLDHFYLSKFLTNPDAQADTYADPAARANPVA